jgi:DNA-binding IclR family transcriptional regulator
VVGDWQGVNARGAWKQNVHSGEPSSRPGTAREQPPIRTPGARQRVVPTGNVVGNGRSSGRTSRKVIVAELQNAARVVQVIEHLTEVGTARLDEVAEVLGVHKSNALRLLATLRGYGWVSVNSARTHYSLGPRLISIGQAAIPDVQLQKTLAIAEEIRDLTGESVHVSVRSGDQMLVVGRVDSFNALRVTCDLGSGDPLHATAVGKMHLATLPPAELEQLVRTLDLVPYTPNTITDPDALVEAVAAIRARRFAMNVEEVRPGVAAIAVAIWFGGGSAPLSLSITAPAPRMGRDEMEQLGPKILELVEPYQFLTG